MSAVLVTVPIRLESVANKREHWARKARRVKSERDAVGWILGNHPRPALPGVVALTRVAPRELDGDNLQAAFKAVRDAVATFLGVADNHAGIRWEYAQRSGGVRVYAVEIGIRASVVSATGGEE